MEKIWHSCFYDYLQIDPSEYGVLLSESLEYSNEDREKCAEIFFENFNCPSLYM